MRASELDAFEGEPESAPAPRGRGLWGAGPAIANEEGWAALAPGTQPSIDRWPRRNREPLTPVRTVLRVHTDDAGALPLAVGGAGSLSFRQRPARMLKEPT